MKGAPVSEKRTTAGERLREALCAASVGHYRGWDYPGMGEAAHMGMDGDDPHGADADALMPVVKAFVQEAMRDYRNHYGRATEPGHLRAATSSKGASE